MGQVGRQEDSLKLPFMLKSLKLFENPVTLRKIEQNNYYIRLSLLNFGFKIKTVCRKHVFCVTFIKSSNRILNNV